MRSRTFALGVLLLPLLLTGCTTAHAASPAPTVTVTVTPTPTPLAAADSAPWDLHALCAAEAEARTLIMWRDQQVKAGRLSPAQSAAVLQAVAVQYLEFDGRGVPEAVQQDVTRLQDSAGELEHPHIDLGSKTVETAQTHIDAECMRNDLTIGIVAQGG